jgi:hypothetical protein
MGFEVYSQRWIEDSVKLGERIELGGYMLNEMRGGEHTLPRADGWLIGCLYSQ